MGTSSEHCCPAHPPPPTLTSRPLALTARIIQEQNVIQAKITPALAGDHRLEEDLRHQTEGSPIARGVHIIHARGGRGFFWGSPGTRWARTS